MAAAAATATSAACETAAVRRAGICHRGCGRGGAIAIAGAGRERRHFARQVGAVAMRTLRAAVAGADERLERTVAAGASIFVDWHAVFPLLGERLREFDQHAAGGLGVQEADHARQAVA